MQLSSAYETVQAELLAAPRSWLVTGAAGFIGSHLVERLLTLGQKVVGLDNLSNGRESNLALVRSALTDLQWQNFRFLRGDIRDLSLCQQAVAGTDCVFHQAALGSVPGSIQDPLRWNESNVTGFLNILTAARDAGVKRFVYASSSSVYGTEESLPKREEKIGAPLSPYAVTKYVNELYADVFARCYGLSNVGLRYFNVFGPRQDPNGAYAAVIPKWLDLMRKGSEVDIYGDGETSRDFCYIANVVQANLLAATVELQGGFHSVFNVACSDRTTLNELFALLRESLLPHLPHLHRLKPRYLPFRPGDVRHSQADISKASQLLGYQPTHTFAEGIAQTVASALRQPGL
jgi:UDP-N-acetylglucosamine 4-epimerase